MRTATIAITGAEGFLGWHLSCRLAATRGVEPLRLGRADLADLTSLRSGLAAVDTIIHVAGVNRAESDDDVERGNVELADTLAAAIGDRPVHVVYANSIQSDLDNAYGRGKRRAAEVLRALPGTFADVVLPNLFGEHGRPAYNSFVSTFCHEVASGREPVVHEDRQVPLLHAQAAAEALIVAAGRESIGDASAYDRMHDRIRGSTLVKHDVAVHNICDEYPDRCVDDLLQFLVKA